MIITDYGSTIIKERRSILKKSFFGITVVALCLISALLICSCESEKKNSGAETEIPTVTETDAKTYAELDGDRCSCGFSNKNHKHIMLCGALYVDYGPLSKQQDYTEDEIEFIGTLKDRVPDGEDPTEDEEGNFDCAGLRYGIYKPHKVYGEMFSWEGSCVVEQADGTLHVYDTQVNPGSTVPDPFRDRYYPPKTGEPTAEEYEEAIKSFGEQAIKAIKDHYDKDGSVDFSKYQVSNAFVTMPDSAYFQPTYFIFRGGKCMNSVRLTMLNRTCYPTFDTGLNDLATKAYEENEPFVIYCSDNGTYFVTENDAILISGKEENENADIPRENLTLNAIELKSLE